MSFTERFTGRAAAYAAGRPSYPPEAIDGMLAGLGDPKKLVVADLGAGTGISSRAIADRGPKVVAVEPNAAMRAAAQPDPRIDWIEGTAEHTGLPECSVDVVAAFQAWHWIDQPQAVAEARRIRRPGGILAIVYNERDERDPVTAAYGEIVRRYAIDAIEARRGQALDRALAIDPMLTLRMEFGNRHVLDRAGMHARVKSTSYLPASGPEAEKMGIEFDSLFDRFCQNDAIEIRLVTIVARIEL